MTAPLTQADKRLAMLEKVTAGGSTDPFHWYGLALEYKGRERDEDALQTFERLRALDPSYVPQYLLHAQVLVRLRRTDEARACLEAGVSTARAKGDAHALSELLRDLEALGGEAP